MKEMKTAYNADVYVMEYRLDSKEKMTCKIPAPTGAQKFVKAIYWAASTDVTVTATMSQKPTSMYAIWENVKPNSTLSPAVTAMKFENTTTNYKYVHLWVIME